MQLAEAFPSRSATYEPTSLGLTCIPHPHPLLRSVPLWRAMCALLSAAKSRAARSAPPLRLVAAQLGELLGLYLAKLAERGGAAVAAGGGGGGEGVGADMEVAGEDGGAAVLMGRQMRTSFGEEGRGARERGAITIGLKQSR